MKDSWPLFLSGLAAGIWLAAVVVLIGLSLGGCCDNGRPTVPDAAPLAGDCTTCDDTRPGPTPDANDCATTPPCYCENQEYCDGLLDGGTN